MQPIIFEPVIFSHLLILLLCIVFLIYINLRILNSKYRNIYIIVIGFKIIFLFYHAYYKNLPMGGVDWTVYTNNAYMIFPLAENLYDIFFVCTDFNLFTRIIASLYLIFGKNPFYIHFIVFLFSLVNFYYIILAANEITDNYELAQKIGIIWTIWPIAFIHSISFLREGPIMCFFTISLYYFIKYVKYHNPVNFILAIIVSIICSMLHAGMIAVFLVYLFVFAFLTLRNNILLTPLKIFFAVLVLILVMQSALKEQMTEKFQNVDSIDDVIAVKQRKIKGETAYITEKPSNLISLILQTPYRFVMFVFSPLPWQVRSFATFISWVLDSLPRLFIVYYLYVLLIKKRKEGTPTQIAIKTSALLLIVAIDLIFCWGTENFGTAIRHRAKILPLELIMLFWYLDIRNQSVSYLDYEEDDEDYEEATENSDRDNIAVA